MQNTINEEALVESKSEHLKKLQSTMFEAALAMAYIIMHAGPMAAIEVCDAAKITQDDIAKMTGATAVLNYMGSDDDHPAPESDLHRMFDNAQTIIKIARNTPAIAERLDKQLAELNKE